MLLIVLLLIVVAAGVLVLAVAAGPAQWAWLSVLLCVVAALLLVVVRGRDRRRGGSGPRHSAHATANGATSGSAAVPEDSGAGGALGSDDLQPEAVEPDRETEPAEQRTDAADVLLVCESEVEVFVIDERPRYHLGGCSWVGERETLPLPAGEARELGFTPCAVCVPDSSVARLERSSG